VKLSKIIFSLALITIGLFFSKAIVFDNFKKLHLQYADAESLVIGDAEAIKSTLNQSVPAASFYLKTPTHSSVTSRIEDRDFLESLFRSFFYNKVRNAGARLNNIYHLQFIPHALKIIYPHHHFW
jgi:hypothetical protein